MIGICIARSGGWTICPDGTRALSIPAVPFALLLSRAAKQHHRRLGPIAALVFVTNIGNVWWLVTPSFQPDGMRWPWREALAFIGIGGLWCATFLSHLRRQPLVPLLAYWRTRNMADALPKYEASRDLNPCDAVLAGFACGIIATLLMVFVALITFFRARAQSCSRPGSERASRIGASERVAAAPALQTDAAVRLARAVRAARRTRRLGSYGWIDRKAGVIPHSHRAGHRTDRRARPARARESSGRRQQLNEEPSSS